MSSASKRREIPNYGLPIIETHCHLDYLTAQSTPELIARCDELNIKRLITIAVSEKNLPLVIELTQQYEPVFGTLGIHPHDADDFSDSVSSFIKTHAKETEKIVAIGEIGLDYYYDNADRNVQRNAFEAQLQIACDLDLPIVVHTREADEDTQAILSNFSNTLKRKGVIHSFTSGQTLAQYCLNEEFHLGFNGICTFNTAQNVRDIIAITPIERVLLETDSPYLTPVPYRGKENAPIYLPFIAEQVAQVHGVDVDVVLKHAYQNSLNVFFNSVV